MALRPLLLSLAVPAAGALLLSAYLTDHPLPASKSRTIKNSLSLSPNCARSPSLKIINPRSFPSNSSSDSHRIILSTPEIGNLTDEEILSRFLRGFFNGWIFYPEHGIISLFGVFGRIMLPVGFSGVEMSGTERQILSPGGIERERLPGKGTVLLGGCFLVLDARVSGKGEEGESFIEIGFGDDRRGFSGMHRFEVSRLANEDSDEAEDWTDTGRKEKEDVQLWCSSISCNPRENKLPFPKWAFGFHQFYAQCLFRDGVRGVLGK